MAASRSTRSPASLHQEGLRHLDEASRAARSAVNDSEQITASASLATAYFAAATLALTFQHGQRATPPVGADIGDTVLPTSDGLATIQANPAVVLLRRQARRFSWTELEGDVDHLLFGHYQGNRLLAIWLMDGEATAAALDGVSMPVGNVANALRQLGTVASSG